MVVDTSALIAMILGEDERPIFDDLVLRSPSAVISVVSVVETIVLTNKRRAPEATQIDATLDTLRIDVRGVTSIKEFWRDRLSIATVVAGIRQH